MQGDAAVIEALNDVLTAELTAINQYFIHAEMCHNWGYHGLGSYIRKQSIDEMKHAEQLIERAHQVCPYSNATRGNIDVTLTRVE